MTDAEHAKPHDWQYEMEQLQLQIEQLQQQLANEKEWGQHMLNDLTSQLAAEREKMEQAEIDAWATAESLRAELFKSREYIEEIRTTTYSDLARQLAVAVDALKDMRGYDHDRVDAALAKIKEWK